MFCKYVNFLQQFQIPCQYMYINTTWVKFFKFINFKLIENIKWFFFYNLKFSLSKKLTLNVKKSPVTPLNADIKISKFAEQHLMFQRKLAYKTLFNFIKYKKLKIKKLKITLVTPHLHFFKITELKKNWQFLVGNLINFLAWTHLETTENVQRTSLKQLKKTPNKPTLRDIFIKSSNKKLKTLFLKNYDYFVTWKIPYSKLEYGFKKLISITPNKTHFDFDTRPYLFLNTTYKINNTIESSLKNQWFLLNYKFYNSISVGYKKKKRKLFWRQVQTKTIKTKKSLKTKFASNHYFIYKKLPVLFDKNKFYFYNLKNPKLSTLSILCFKTEEKFKKLFDKFSFYKTWIHFNETTRQMLNFTHVRIHMQKLTELIIFNKTQLNLIWKQPLLASVTTTLTEMNSLTLTDDVSELQENLVEQSAHFTDSFVKQHPLKNEKFVSTLAWKNVKNKLWISKKYNKMSNRETFNCKKFLDMHAEKSTIFSQFNLLTYHTYFQTNFLTTFDGFMYLTSVFYTNSTDNISELKKTMLSFAHKYEMHRRILKLSIKNKIFSFLSSSNYETTLDVLNQNASGFFNLPQNKLLKQNTNMLRNLHFQKNNVFSKNYFQQNITDLDMPSNLAIKRIKFKPGYRRIWKEARAVARVSLNVKYKYEFRLTRYFLRYKKYARLNLTLPLEMTLFSILKQINFVFYTHYVENFINNKLVFVNGILCLNKNLQIYLNDFIQFAVNFAYYVAYKYIWNFFLKRKLKLKIRLKKKSSNIEPSLNKKKSSTFPQWLLFEKNVENDIPKFLEADFFSLSFFILYEPFLLTEPHDLAENNIRPSIINMYNWKYIT